MAKGPVVTPEVEALIASVYQKHRKWKAPTVRNEVESILRKKDRTLPKGWPSLSKVQKVLATVRQNLASPSPEDEPWSISTLKDDSPIPPEALPTILRLWIFRRENFGHDLTIREAKWAGRLYAIGSNLPVDMFSFFTSVYTISERMYELAGKRFITAHALDLFLFFLMAHEEVTPERVKKVLEQRDLEIYLNLTKLGATWGEGKEHEVAVFEDITPLRKRGGTK